MGFFYMVALKEILNIIISWPFALTVIVILLRKPAVALVDRLVKSEHGKAKMGPVEIELGEIAQEGRQAISNLNRLNILMAESRLLELEITNSMFGSVFTTEQQNKMKYHISELKNLVSNKSEYKG